MNNTIFGGTTVTPVPLSVTDQTYNPNSENAQSGIAVAEAIKTLDKPYELIEEITIPSDKIKWIEITEEPDDWEDNWYTYYTGYYNVRLEDYFNEYMPFEEVRNYPFDEGYDEETGENYPITFPVYRKVETIAEQINQVQRTEEPDGTPYNFKAVILELKVGSTVTTDRLNVSLSNTSLLSKSNSAGFSGLIRAKIQHGRLFGDVIVAGTTPTTADVTAQGTTVKSKIDKIIIRVGNGRTGNFVQGNTIKIWGVRA